MARPALGRSQRWEQQEKAAVLEFLGRGPARLETIAQHLVRDPSNAHLVIRRLRDEDKVHSDSGYWVLGPRKQRR